MRLVAGTLAARSRALLICGGVMIYLYSGTPGSGKSLHAVCDMLSANDRDFPVIANFKINPKVIRNPDRMIFRDNASLVPSYLEAYAQSYWQSQGVRVVENRILLVIDECQLIYNSRDWKKNSGWVSFFTQHRKMGYKVIMIAQQREMIDKQIRAVLEYEYLHRVLANAGIFGWALTFVLGSRFLYRKEMAQIRSAGKGMNLGFKVAHYGRRCFRAYDTFQTW